MQGWDVHGVSGFELGAYLPSWLSESLTPRHLRLYFILLFTPRNTLVESIDILFGARLV